jgi:hypothetical protein
MNIDFIEGALTSAVAIVPIIVALVQVAKMVGLPNKYAPLVSIGAGVLIGFLFGHEGNDMSQTILSGVIYGLSASGLYSGIKTTAHAQNGDQSTNPLSANLLKAETDENGNKVMFVETDKEKNH